MPLLEKRVCGLGQGSEKTILVVGGGENTFGLDDGGGAAGGAQEMCEQSPLCPWTRPDQSDQIRPDRRGETGKLSELMEQREGQARQQRLRLDFILILYSASCRAE